MVSVRDRLADARLYLVCEEPEPRWLEAALRGGVELVQLRMKSAPDGAILAAAKWMRELCHRHGALLLLNDRPDLAAAAELDGVHVGQDDVAPTQARELVGEERLVGLSTHSPEQIAAAAELPVDYIGVGPVHATPTKPGRSAVGLELVRHAAAAAAVPFFAIGGLDHENIHQVVDAGGRRVAVVRALTREAEPEAAARALRRALAEVPVGAT